jgi:UDP-N-acetylglucosamine--dolichyl-phosphate N-acetylglucosaminephosphotransferase
MKKMSGKDLGKRGTDLQEVPVPEALGILPAIVFLISTIVWQHFFADNSSNLQFHSALFSICFMIFLGFTDDTLDLPWRVKMVIPLFAAGPLISTYDGLTSLSVPEPFNTWLINEQTHSHTLLGQCLGLIPGVIVDLNGHGKVVELGYLFKAFIACLAIFCTNAINILAGKKSIDTI